jgi:D-alanine-D-alanine ligase
MEKSFCMNSRKISILFCRPASMAGADDQDTLDQAETVSTALEDLGYETREIEADMNLAEFRRTLGKHRGSLIFNLFDPSAGEGRFISLFPHILEQESIPYTGCSADTLYLTSHKIISKRMMIRQGISTPFWYEAGGVPSGTFSPGRYIVKSVWEHGSAGLTSDSVVEVSREEELDELLAASGGGFFAERFLSGREINVALLSDGKDSWEVLPPSEIIYSGKNEHNPFLDYRAKWDESCESYQNSLRSFDFGSDDDPMLQQLTAIARECAGLFSLKGYARVDFRMDETGQPHVLEVNANPCISPGAGFPEAAAKAGISYHEMIERIVASSGGKR